MRLIFFALLLANVAVFAWQHYGHKTRPATATADNAATYGKPLRLLKERSTTASEDSE